MEERQEEIAARRRAEEKELEDSLGIEEEMEEEMSEEAKRQLEQLAQAWEEGQARSTYVRTLIEEARWKIVRDVWEAKTRTMPPEMREPCWLAYKGTELARRQYTYLLEVERRKTALVRSIIQANSAVMSGTVEQVKLWEREWAELDPIRWRNYVEDIEWRWKKETEKKATEGNEWQTEATKVWVTTLSKCKEIFHIHQLVAEAEKKGGVHQLAADMEAQGLIVPREAESDNSGGEEEQQTKEEVVTEMSDMIAGLSAEELDELSI